MISQSILPACAPFLALFITAGSVLGQGTAFTYQGRLTDGTNGLDGSYDLRFGVFNAPGGGGPAAAPITRRATEVHGGLFTATLDFGPEVFSGPELWLEISVRTNGVNDFTTLAPRQRLTPTPYAITAASLSGSLDPSQLSGPLPSAALAGEYAGPLSLLNESNHYAGDGSALQFGGGFGYCNLPCYWGLMGNSGTAPGLNFIGTTDNTPLEFRVNGQRALRLESTTNSNVVNIIGGSRANYVNTDTLGATIAGGGNPPQPNVVEANYGSVGGGIGNSILSEADFSTIGGGLGNTVKMTAIIATIAGGTAHTIGERAFDAVIGGGFLNTIGNGCQQATISGGGLNMINAGASWSTISGGWNNSIESNLDAGTIGGGVVNVIGSQSFWATISGGQGNRAAPGSRGGTVSGGLGNQVDGQYSSIAGGYSNLVTGSFAMVAGGQENAAADYSFAAGTRAKAIHDGSFVWASGNAHDYPSSTSNRVHFYAAGGLEVEYAGQDADGRGLKWLVLASQQPGRVINVFNGAYLSDGGAWTDSSDRNAKENFEPVNPAEILERVAALPLHSWSYRSESNSVRHLGPVAQDFHSAFGLGADDKHIAALDSSGVALAAIQGLQRELRAKQAEIDRLNQRLAAIERRVEELTH
ncbi:MAG TPA: tail fiber domain-containing protein [Verrucomicrobiae bacterium]|nr:tail fiber domain-containing protein [Verrucomicrobiae bacterium]